MGWVRATPGLWAASKAPMLGALQRGRCSLVSSAANPDLEQAAVEEAVVDGVEDVVGVDGVALDRWPIEKGDDKTK